MSDTSEHHYPVFEDPRWSTLPQPIRLQTGSPAVPIGFGLVVAALLGVALFVVGQAFYVYVLYNAVIGSGIAWALTKGAERVNYADEGVLAVGAIGLSIVPYVVLHLGFYWSMTQELPPPHPGILEFLEMRARYEQLWGFEPGIVGNAIIWLVEIGITAVVAVGGASSAAQGVRLSRVPAPVAGFVLASMIEGRERPSIEHALSKRGWSRSKDQAQAFESGARLAEAIREQQDEQERGG